MKWFLRLFAVYFISLSLFPCSDGKDCEQPVAQEQTTKVAKTTEHTDHNDHEENCPPVCHCGCCGVQVINFCNCIKIAPPKTFSAPISSELQFQLSEIYLPIWQPPQLG